MRRKIPILILAILLLGGCTMAPRYTRPEAPIPKEWPEGAAYKEVKPEEAPFATELKWRDFITDERLQKVIEMALKNNRDFKIAALNVDKARAYYRIQRAELLPALDVAATEIRERVPADLSSKNRTNVMEQYSVDFGVLSWEIDFFGRLRSLKDEALEAYLATEEAHRSAQIMLINSTASAYLTYAADRENLRLSEDTLKTQRDSYALIKRRYDVGLASELDLRRAQTQVEAARESVARYLQVVAQDKNALDLLAGAKIPEELLPEGLNSVTPPKDVSPGLSSEVLLRRPDIMASEHMLKSINAFIGAARAAFFPRVSLTTTIGTASEELSRLFRSGQDTWSFSPQITMPIFDTRVWAGYEAAKVEREITLANYEKTIQTAFKEVADTLAVRGTVDEQLSAQRALVEATSVTYRLANERYIKGIDSYLSVLDAQRSLFTAQQGLIAVYLSRLVNQVKLYAVLGGGYE